MVVDLHIEDLVESLENIGCQISGISYTLRCVCMTEMETKLARDKQKATKCNFDQNR